MGFRERGLGPIDRLAGAQESVHEVEDRIQIVIVRTGAIRPSCTTQPVERIAFLLSDALPLDPKVYERPTSLVCSIAETGDKRRTSSRVVEAFVEDFENVGQGNLANTGMPHDFGDEVQDHRRFVRIGGPVEHPINAKGVGDESTPIDGLPFEDERNFGGDNLRFLVVRDEQTGPPFGQCPPPEALDIRSHRYECLKERFPMLFVTAPSEVPNKVGPMVADAMRTTHKISATATVSDAAH